MEPGDMTIDPLTMEAMDAFVAPRPVVDLLFHPDLRRIGAVAEVPRGGLRIGRTEANFRQGYQSAPIGDPCISRAQLSLRWLDQGVFQINAAEGARRPVSCFDPEGRPVDPRRAPPGTVVSIGDRVLLGLDCRAPLDPRAAELGLVGESAALQSLLQRVLRFAVSEGAALITGETGVGKELVARALHAAGPRAAGPFLVVNCATIPEHLFESELFGHRKGAFTGATADHTGLFRAAEGGVVFLDEVGELPLSLQAKLLRALQERRIKVVGEPEERDVDVRVVAATNRELEAEVEAGRFRADLMFRLRALQLRVPPLRERRADVPRLFAHFLAQRATPGAPLERLFRAADKHRPPVPAAFVAALLRWPWPGNVRELLNLVTEVSAENHHAGPFTLPAWPGLDAPAPLDTAPAPSHKPGEVPEPGAVLAALAAHDYNQANAATALGVSRSTLLRWMDGLGLPRARDLGPEEIAAARASVGDEVAAIAAHLRVSTRALRLRLKALGLS